MRFMSLLGIAAVAVARASNLRSSAGKSALKSGTADATLLWVQHEDVAVYTSAGLSRHVSGPPTFATA